MVKRRIKSPTGEVIEAEVVDIEEIDDRPIIIKLSDGSTLRMKIDVIEVVRADGLWDPEGFPSYNVRSGNILSILESPDHLKRKD